MKAPVSCILLCLHSGKKSKARLAFECIFGNNLIISIFSGMGFVHKISYKKFQTIICTKTLTLYHFSGICDLPLLPKKLLKKLTSESQF